MPATGDRITKRKDGLFQGMYTAQTPSGPKRKYVYSRKKKDESWLSDCLKPLLDAGKITYSTYKRYADIVEKHLKPAVGHRKLKDLTRAEVRKLYAAKGATLSPRSVDYVHITLQKALSQAVRDDLIPRTWRPASDPTAPATRRRTA
jgi:integrase